MNNELIEQNAHRFFSVSYRRNSSSASMFASSSANWDCFPSSSDFKTSLSTIWRGERADLTDWLFCDWREQKKGRTHCQTLEQCDIPQTPFPSLRRECGVLCDSRTDTRPLFNRFAAPKQRARASWRTGTTGRVALPFDLKAGDSWNRGRDLWANWEFLIFTSSIFKKFDSWGGRPSTCW